MPINTAIEKAILRQLHDVFPGFIKQARDIFPAHANREEIINYLFDFREQGWVMFTDLASKDYRDCCNIKITRHGINYLESLS